MLKRGLASWSSAVLLYWIKKHCRFAVLTHEALPFCCTDSRSTAILLYHSASWSTAILQWLTQLHEALLFCCDWLMKHCHFAVTGSASWSTAVLLYRLCFMKHYCFAVPDSASWSTAVLLRPTQLHEALQFSCDWLRFMKCCSLAATGSVSWSVAVLLRLAQLHEALPFCCNWLSFMKRCKFAVTGKLKGVKGGSCWQGQLQVCNRCTGYKFYKCD